MRKKTLRRGEAGMPEIRDALEDLGIKAGEDFAIVPAKDLEESVSLNGASRSNDIDTAKLAARVNRDNADGIVLAELARLVGGTSKEIARNLDWPRDSVTPRIGALKRAGLIERVGEEKRDGEQVVRLTPSGKDKAHAFGVNMPKAPDDGGQLFDAPVTSGARGFGDSDV